MSIILDLIVIAIIVLIAFLSARRGFVRTVIEVVGFFAAIILAYAISTPMASLTYDRVIEPPLLTAAQQSASGSAEEWVDSAWSSLPGFITNSAGYFGLTRESLLQKVSANASEGIVSAATTASQAVAKPVVTKVLGLAYSTLLVIILLFVVRILAKFVNKLFSFSLVGRLNRTLGGVVGALKGLLIALVFCMFVTLIVSLTSNGFFIFTEETIDGSYLFRALASFSPFVG